MITRINKMGLYYQLSKVDANRTRINFKGKYIIVNMSLEDVSQCWFNWNMKGEFIQTAFPLLNPSEREFLMTGLTNQEWNETFNTPEDIIDPRD